MFTYPSNVTEQQEQKRRKEKKEEKKGWGKEGKKKKRKEKKEAKAKMQRTEGRSSDSWTHVCSWGPGEVFIHRLYKSRFSHGFISKRLKIPRIEMAQSPQDPPPLLS